jgi:hypothetical protein
MAWFLDVIATRQSARAQFPRHWKTSGAERVLWRGNGVRWTNILKGILGIAFTGLTFGGYPAK